MTPDPDPRPADRTLSTLVIVLTTLPAEADAEAFAQVLVREHLAACVGIGPPMTSVYTWRGALERTPERQLILKTVGSRVPALKARLAALHPYEVPEVIVLPAADGSDAYLAWVRESTSG